MNRWKGLPYFIVFKERKKCIFTPKIRQKFQKIALKILKNYGIDELPGFSAPNMSYNSAINF